MVFWKKKAKGPGEGSAQAEGAGAPRGAAAAGVAPGDATQFLTGDAREDQRRTDSLLEEYASIAERVVQLTGKQLRSYEA